MLIHSQTYSLTTTMIQRRLVIRMTYMKGNNDGILKGEGYTNPTYDERKLYNNIYFVAISKSIEVFIQFNIQLYPLLVV